MQVWSVWRCPYGGGVFMRWGLYEVGSVWRWGLYRGEVCMEA